MKRIALVIACYFAFSAQTPAPIHHLVYEFGYNTQVASSGQGTGTTTIDIGAPASDGGVTIGAADFWWNTVRPRATNTCELYRNGDLKCTQAPYAVSPIQVTILSLLAHGFFRPLNANPTTQWDQAFSVYAALLPGGSGFAGQPNTWNFTLSLQGKGLAPHSNHLLLVEGNGTLSQEGGRYLQGKAKMSVLYDSTLKLPVFVSQVRTHIPMTSVYSNDLVQLKLVKFSR